MAKIKTHNVYILKKLVEAGFKDKKDIVKISLYDALCIKSFSRPDLLAVCELQTALQNDDILPFLIDENDEGATQTEEEFNREIRENSLMG